MIQKHQSENESGEKEKKCLEAKTTVECLTEERLVGEPFDKLSLLSPARVESLGWNQQEGRGSPAISFLLPRPAAPVAFSFLMLH